jgi:ribonuclease D
VDDEVDPAPLAEVLADPEVELVVHAGRQDVALLRRVWRTEVRGVFDTQVAAGFAGFGAQTGYGSLLHDVLGLRLAKSASFTRWDDRPLSPEQLAYARDDVAHLLRLADALQENPRTRTRTTARTRTKAGQREGRGRGQEGGGARAQGGGADRQGQDPPPATTQIQQAVAQLVQAVQQAG